MSVARLPVFGRQGKRLWTADEDAVLLSTSSNAEASSKLDRTMSACATRRKQLRQEGETVEAPANAWTPEDDALLLTNMTMGEIRKRTGRTINAIKARRVRLRARSKR